MPRIKLAFWHGDRKPGDEIDVTDDELANLRRDGRVAVVLTANAPETAGDKPAEQTVDGPEASSLPAESRSRKGR